MVTNFAGDTEGAPLYASVSGPKEGPAVVLLHGLFGMGNNLGQLGRALADHFFVHQLDLPNHGRSPWQDPMTLSSLSAAVADYLQHTGLHEVSIVGHSLGGKVAMELGLNHPERVSAVAIADIAPLAYRGSHDDVFAGIEAVAGAEPSSRRQAGELLSGYVGEAGVVQFLLLSLRRDDDGIYRWRFNAEALRSNYAALREPPSAPAPFQGPALFIYGTESGYVREQGVSAAQRLFPQAEFVALEGAGHWLHAEQPEAFNNAVRAFLLQAPGGQGS